MSSSLAKDDLRGVIPPVLSTFDEDEEVDVDLFLREIHFMRDSGIELAVVGGSTGEGEVLTPDELATLVRAAVEDGSLGVIAGVITTNTRDAVHRGLVARSAGASALMVAPPIYVKPSPDGLAHYVEDIWKGTELPIVIYNHFGFPPKILLHVAQIPGVIGIKEISVESVSELVQTAGERLVVLGGADPINVVSFVLGAKGAIAGINTVLPKHSVEVFTAYEKGDLAKARQILDKIAPLARLMIEPVNFPARVKAAINLQGREVGLARRPCIPLKSDEEAEIREALVLAEVLEVNV